MRPGLFYRSLSSAPQHQQQSQSVSRGELASNTLTGEWERALDDLRVLRDHIDGQRASTSSSSACDEQQLSHEHILQKRVWLLHRSLFVFFNHPSGRVKLVEMFLSQSYLNAIQMSCWWLLRYLVVALIVTQRQCTRRLCRQGGGASHTSKLQTRASPSGAFQGHPNGSVPPRRSVCRLFPPALILSWTLIERRKSSQRLSAWRMVTFSCMTRPTRSWSRPACW